MSSDWITKTIGEVSINLDKKRKPIKATERKSGPFPYYGASGIVDYVDSYLFDGEYLLVAEDGENLKTLNTPIAFSARGKFWVNNHAHILKGKEEVLTDFIRFWLLSNSISGYLSGAVMPKLTQAALNSIPITFPDKSIQKKIVRVLTCLEHTVEILKEQNTTLEALAQTLFRSWFVNFDPVHAKAAGQTPEGMSLELAALFPSEFVESELGMIPKGWRVAKVAELGQVICGKTPSTANPDFYGADIPFITIPDMHGKACIYETSKNLSLVGAESQKNKFLPVGSICMSCIATPGLVVFTTRPSQTNQQINSVVPLPEFGREFSFFAVKGIATEVRLQGSSGSVFHNLNKSSFENIVLTMPTVDLISAFNKASSPILETIVCNHLQISALERIRDELLPRLISGKLRIEEAEEVVSEVLDSTTEEVKAA